MRALVLLMALPGAALANPVDELGFGARAIAMGGAATALADDFAATYYNPAGLATSGLLRLELGYTYNEPALELSGGDLDVDPIRGLQAGIVVPGRALDRKLAFAVGIHLPDDRLSRIRALPQRQPRFALYDNRPQRIWINVSAAAEIVEDLYLGAGLTFLSNTEGSLDIAGVVNATSLERTRLYSAVDVNLSAVRYASAGILWRPGPWRVGVSFRDEFSLHLDLDVKVSGTVTLGAEDLVLVEQGSFLLQALNDNLFSARQVSLGVGYVGARLAASLEATWLQWSRFRAPSSAIDIGLDLGDLPFAIPPPDRPEPPGFSDIVILRAGAEHLVAEWATGKLVLRGGVFFEPTPAPEQPGGTNYVDSDRIGVGLGLGLELGIWRDVLPQPLVWDFAAQLVNLVRRTYTKTDPADPVGDYDAGGRIYGGASTLRLLF